jgi:single-strand DNA-binding protein
MLSDLNLIAHFLKFIHKAISKASNFYICISKNLKKYIHMLKLTAIGNLGKDAIIGNANGKTVINFSVAHSEKYKDQAGNQQERTTWVECAYWTERTAIVPYLKKGTTVYVEGNPSVEMYTTNQGTSGVKMRLNVREVQLLGGNRDNTNNGGNAGQTSEQQMPSNNPNPVQAAPSFNNGSFAAPSAPTGGDDGLPF